MQTTLQTFQGKLGSAEDGVCNRMSKGTMSQQHQGDCSLLNSTKHAEAAAVKSNAGKFVTKTSNNKVEFD
jgi:hypothetical protein